MRIRNENAQKEFIVPAKDVKKGGLRSEDGLTVRFRPKDTIDMVEEKALKLAETYDNILIMDEVPEKEEKPKKGK